MITGGATLPAACANCIPSWRVPRWTFVWRVRASLRMTGWDRGRLRWCIASTSVRTASACPARRRCRPLRPRFSVGVRGGGGCLVPVGHGGERGEPAPWGVRADSRRSVAPANVRQCYIALRNGLSGNYRLSCLLSCGSRGFRCGRIVELRRTGLCMSAPGVAGRSVKVIIVNA